MFNNVPFSRKLFNKVKCELISWAWGWSLKAKDKGKGCAWWKEISLIEYFIRILLEYLLIILPISISLAQKIILHKFVVDLGHWTQNWDEDKKREKEKGLNQLNGWERGKMSNGTVYKQNSKSCWSAVW